MLSLFTLFWPSAFHFSALLNGHGVKPPELQLKPVRNYLVPMNVYICPFTPPPAPENQARSLCLVVRLSYEMTDCFSIKNNDLKKLSSSASATSTVP